MELLWLIFPLEHALESWWFSMKISVLFLEFLWQIQEVHVQICSVVHCTCRSMCVRFFLLA